MRQDFFYQNAKIIKEIFEKHNGRTVYITFEHGFAGVYLIIDSNVAEIIKNFLIPIKAALDKLADEKGTLFAGALTPLFSEKELPKQFKQASFQEFLAKGLLKEAYAGNLAIVNYLLATGISPDYQVQSTGETALHRVLQRITELRYELAKTEDEEEHKIYANNITKSLEVG